jgi:ribosomal-protein-alanine N-acetyltransferase
MLPALTGNEMKFYLETERLILRDLIPSDVEGIFELDTNPEVHRYLGKRPIKTKQQAQESIRFIREQYEARGIGRFAAVEKSSGSFIGWSGIKLNQGEKEALNGRTKFYDIGYRLIPRYWGKGYATESSLAALDFGFRELAIELMCGAAVIDNIASNIILKRIGLQFINKFEFEDERVYWYELKRQDYGKTMP